MACRQHSTARQRLTAAPQDIAQIVVSLGMARVPRDRLTIGRNCFIEPVQFLKGIAAIGDGIGKSRVDPDGTIEAGESVVRATEPQQHQAAVIVVVGHRRRARDRGIDQGQGFTGMAGLVADDAQQMQHVRMFASAFQ